MSFYDLTRRDLGSLLVREGFVDSHAATLYRRTYALRPRADDPSRLPKRLGAAFSPDFFDLPLSESVQKQSQYDGTTKFLHRLRDGSQIESVLISEKGRLTLCLSSQVGCRQACAFCYTGRMGLVRNLSIGEIVAQVLHANRWLTDNRLWAERFGMLERVSNLVFMGMGEPLDNVSALVGAIDILTDRCGIGIAQRRISVSTAGHLDGLEEFVRQCPRIPIALSLHAANDKLRTRIMPINRRFPLSDLMKAIDKVHQTSKNHVLIQYVVIGGVNDGVNDAKELADLLEGRPVKVNLIPFNDVEPSAFRSPSPESIIRFRDYLHRCGLRVMVRYSKGQDIEAACGQLVSKELVN